MNLVLIGNGFDLSHGLKTSYKDFITYINRNGPNDDSNGSNESFYNFLFNEYKKRTGINDKYTHIEDNVIFKELESEENLNWYDIESAYFSLLKKSENPTLINAHLNDIKISLSEYLKIRSSETKPLNSYKYLFSKFKSELIAINFNYTSTLDLYKDNFQEIIHIHGKIEDLLNPMIFGYAAEKAETEKLLKKNNDAFIENIKQYEYLNANNFRRLLALIKSNTFDDPRINVFIMGHSCGLSDQLILEEIMGGKGIRNIYNFYHKGMPDHKIKLINLNRTINEDLGFSKYVSFPDSLRMPQHDKDITQEEIDAFIKKYKATSPPPSVHHSV